MPAVAVEARARAVVTAAAEVALASNAEVAATVLSSSGAAAAARSFAEEPIFAARTSACVRALASASVGAATAGVIAIADHASVCTSEEAVAGVIGIIGAGACCATVTPITIGGIAMGVGANNNMTR